MKKIIMYTRVDDCPKDDPLIEDYLIEDNQDSTEYAQNLLDNFNASLRPEESSRTLLKVEEESLGPISTAEEFITEAQSFKLWVYQNGSKHTVDEDTLEEIYDNMLDIGDVEAFQDVIEDSGCENYTDHFQRIIDSPIKNLRTADLDALIQEVKKMKKENEEL
ncbi:hypothetical protein LCGC14_1129050 [marine sediment metagenome]|uniref:Uncharacterized protein n=1 Tax=marine sediment metagenome TaxID=412755 RepID=A0A0F9M6G8_9ZZZZ|nr:hypothetical protein [Methylophaga sp.]